MKLTDSSSRPSLNSCQMCPGPMRISVSINASLLPRFALFISVLLYTNLSCLALLSSLRIVIAFVLGYLRLTTLLSLINKVTVKCVGVAVMEASLKSVGGFIKEL